MDLTTVGEDVAVLHDGAAVHRHTGLTPGTEHTIEGVTFRTLPRPGGELLARIATINDVHFGEVECGVIEGLDLGPVLSSAPGEPPYPEMMNAAAVTEIAAIEPNAVIAKGDLTNDGLDEEYAAFLACWQGRFGDRLHHVRGNHDAYRGQTYADWPWQEVVLPGVHLAILDTALPHHSGGRVTGEQLEWLDTLAADADRPVLVFGHHHPWSPDSASREATYFGINPDDSELLVEVAARRPAIVGYFAGHTHRNRVRRFRATGEMPWVEVACVKDFPGAWAEYRVYEGGILQLHHRISTPDALAWSERTREMFAGTYAGYAFGALEDRCFAIPARESARGLLA